MMYFRPRRPTLLKVTLLPDIVWGRQCVQPVYLPNGTAATVTAFQAMRELDLSGSLEVRFFKIVAYNRILPGWKPDKLLPIAAMNDFIETIGPVEFWKGAE